MATPIVEHKLRLLLETKLDEKQKQQVGKQLKGILEGAVIGFDEAETKKNLLPIINTIKQLFDKAEIKFDADKLLQMPSQDALREVANLTAEQFQTAFDRALAKSGGIKIDFGNANLSAATAPLKRLTEEVTEISQKLKNETQKSVSDIENTINRLNKPTKNPNTKKPIDGAVEEVVEKASKAEQIANQIEKTLNKVNKKSQLTKETSAINALQAAQKAYKTSVENDDPWEIQYQHLLTFVSKYEAVAKKIKPLIDEKHPEFASMYEILSPKAAGAKLSLENFMNLAKGNELSEYKNQPWAREDTLKKIEQTLSNGIPVKVDTDGVNNSSADDEHTVNDEELKLAEQRRKEEERITRAIKERAPYEVYRSIQSPKNSGKSKKDALEDFGAEVWATDKETALSYANNHIGTSSLLKAKIRPVNPLIFDANEKFWSEFDQIPGLKEFFPGLVDYMKDHLEEETQKWIHEQAKKLGFDSVIFENVRDNLDSDKDGDSDTTTTIAVLDDAIVSLEGAFGQLKKAADDGSKRFSSNLIDAPKYYERTGDIDDNQYLTTLQDRQAKINNAYESIMSALNIKLDEQINTLREAEQKVKNNPESILAKEKRETAQSDVEATIALMRKFQQQMEYNQKTLQIEIDDYMQKIGASVVEHDVTPNVDTNKQEESGVKRTIDNSSILSEISAKLDSLATDANLNSVKDAIVSTITSDREHNVDINTNSLIDALSKIQVAPNNNNDDKNNVSIDETSLKNVLSTITYNVKSVQDIEAADNKIAIDETSLEATLNKVFVNVINKPTQQNDSQPEQAQFALESTLQLVKIVLDNIQTNTTRIDVANQPSIDPIAGTTLDNRLTEIKSVLESINQKIVDGGKIINRDGAKQAYKESSQYDTSSKQTARSNMMKSLINDYKTMGKLAAQFASDEDLQTKAMLKNLKEEISRKRKSLNLTMDENQSLREKYNIAFDAEKRLLDAAKEQEKIDKEDRDKQTNWKKQVKDAQRETGINAADSTYRATNNTVIRAIGTEGISADIEAKAKELDAQNKALNVLRNTIATQDADASDEQREALSKQISKVKELKTELDSYLKLHEKYSGDDAEKFDVDTSNFGAVGTDQYWNNITAAIKNATSGKVTIKELNAETGELTGTTKIAANTFAQWSATVDPITGKLSMLRTGIKKTETIMEAISRKTKEIFTYFSGSSIIFKFFNEFKRGVQYVREIDLALTELKKVTNETEQVYNKFLDTAAKTADKLGSTMKEVISSTADFARLGYSLKDAATMAESAQVLMNVSEFTDISTATDTLISAMQAFKYTAEESMDVVNILNIVGNNYAISTSDLAESLTRSSASLVAAGNSLEQAAALTVAGNTILQDPEGVGNALKVVAMRIRGTASELEDAGEETDGLIESTSKLQAKIQALSGVNILNDDGSYKDTYTILYELGKVYGDLSDLAKADILETIAGKTRGSAVAAILQNYELLEDAYNTSLNADGSAARELNVYLDSIQGKIDQFNNAVQSLWSNLLKSDWIKNVVSWFTKIIQSLDTTRGKLIAIVKATALLMAYKKINPFEWATKFTDIKNTINNVGLKNYVMSLFQVSAAQKTVTADTLVNTIAQEQNNVATQQQIISKLGLTNVTGALTAAQKLQAAQELVTLFNGGMITEDLATRMAAMLGYKFSVDAANTATVALDTTTKSFMATNPVGWILLIVSAVVALVTWLSRIPSKIEKLTEKLNDLKSSLRDTQDELNSVNSELKTTQDRMAELLAKDKLTFTEKEELDNLKKQNDELQRKLDLLELEKKQKRDLVSDTFIETMKETELNGKEYYSDGSKVSWFSEMGFNWGSSQSGKPVHPGYETQKETMDRLMQEYEKASDKRKTEIKQDIVNRFEKLMSASEGVDYYTGDNLTDNQKETNEWLDYINNMRDKWAITSGGENAKTNALNRIFNKDENKNISESIKEYVKAMQDGDASAEKSIENLISNNEELREDIEQSGMKIDDAINYWTMLGSQEDINLKLDIAADYEKINEVLDKIQDAYSTLTDAVEQYNKNGYLTLDNLQSLLSLEPEYLSLLQMENGQLSINQSAMADMIQTKLDEAKATAVQSAITRLKALADRTAADATNESANAANNAISKLGSYASSLGIVSQNAISAASAVSAFNAAVEGAQGNEFVDQSEIDSVFTDLNNQITLIDSIGANLKSNFTNIVDPNKGSGSDADDVFQKEMDYWENRIAANQAKYEQIQNEIDLLEKKGQKADVSFYKEQEELEKQRLNLLRQQKQAALDRLAVVEAAEGQGSENWWEIANTLNDIEGELDDVTASIVDLQDAIGEIETYKFEEFNTRLDNLISKLDTIRNLIAPDGEEDWFDDEGNWTEAGVAVLGSQLQSLEMYKSAYQKTIDELVKYQSSYAGNEKYYEELGIHSEQEYYDKTEELISQQYDYAESISDTEQSVVDMYESNIDAVEEYTQTLIDGYNDYIDSVKEALDAERDLYDFKKNVQKQAKDIAAIERRIASLSGSTNKADIAERRKLEAQLYESRESLNDAYYDHAQNAQQEALDKEAQAYETAMTNMVDGIRTSLEEATRNMDEFLMGVTSMVMYNADTVLDKYEETNLPLTKELTNPWEEAKKATSSYSGNALDIMNKWTKEGGFFAQFNATGTTNLESPWSAGTTAATNFQTDVGKVMYGVVSNIETNVKTASGELSKLYQQIKDTEEKALSATVTPNGGNQQQYGPQPQKKYYTTATVKVGTKTLSVTESGDSATQSKSRAAISILGEYEKLKGNSLSAESMWLRTYRNNIEYKTKYYAKGTLGTKRNEWAITDELGPELKMYATPEGNLSFMAVGSTVVPHDLTMELMELPGIVDGLINSPKFDSGLNMVSNAINKPEITIDVENFLKVDRVDKDTLPQLEAMMDKKIDTFAKQLNYSIKKFNR